MQGLLARLPALVAMLEGGGTNGALTPNAQATPYGCLAPPLGQARLKAVELVYALLLLGDPAGEQGALPGQAASMLSGAPCLQPWA